MFSKSIKIFLASAVFISCANSSSEVIEELFSMPKKIKESSAVEVTEKSDLIWTLEDSGNEPQLFALNIKGELVNTLEIKNAQNNDWEDLTSDKDGNLYIGDFGNNDNDRKDLTIYKINASDLTKKEASFAEKISFYYPQQTLFPPKKSERFYDVESFFLFEDNFYLFTKNRSSKFDGTTLLYQVPNKSGNHPAKLISSFKTCDNFNHCAVTSADISPDGKKIALLSADKVWIFTDFTSNNFLSGKVEQIDLKSFTQKEGICFVGNDKLYITDEKDHLTGGKLYQLKLKR
ncbi:WD40 repeat protein [Flavobacterium arsenatis]|uniref:WD40 repeat protein n=2 Tax=Flavobacterium arsenatis TaxID=1484332 RepID=A0ABU1TP29_9FLAO|nr:WD40 repeat protein [Flavobacterium arsenatis]